MLHSGGCEELGKTDSDYLRTAASFSGFFNEFWYVVVDFLFLESMK
jgi:hypothetical protein